MLANCATVVIKFKHLEHYLISWPKEESVSEAPASKIIDPTETLKVGDTCRVRTRGSRDLYSGTISAIGKFINLILL